ncbi:MAG TPA: site-2 protease family protein [Candidatus Sumerlaeota bacterium]|nr:site-2 protease family protein [Candidatus Sumerlaeota bacterium]HPS01563.1 site-2 protease family protein [Candidatus Sumerlaeota bacterium]
MEGGLSGLAQGILTLPVLWFSLICHEVAHAYAAYRAGDDTARLQGRISLDPRAHLDPVGTILIPIIMIFSPVRLPLIGWAKPVQINPLRFRSGKWKIIVALAGVTVNLALVLVAVLLLKLFMVSGLASHMSPDMQAFNAFDMLFFVLERFMLLNLVLMIFNLLPIPPLDGSHVVLYFIRTRESVAFRVFEFVERYSFIILILLMYTGVLKYVFQPVFWVFSKFLDFVM